MNHAFLKKGKSHNCFLLHSLVVVEKKNTNCSNGHDSYYSCNIYISYKSLVNMICA